jgi:hypothetical protein
LIEPDPFTFQSTAMAPKRARDTKVRKMSGSRDPNEEFELQYDVFKAFEVQERRLRIALMLIIIGLCRQSQDQLR